MTYLLSADCENGCIFICYTGDEIARGVRAVIDEVGADARMRVQPMSLHDYRFVEGGLSSTELRALADYRRSHSDELSEARIYKAYSEDIDGEICAFRTFEEEADWLGLPEGFADPLAGPA
jgi:hypothetical protein